MDDLSKEYIVSFFERNLMLHGDRPEAVRWTSQGQRRHYETLLGVGELNGKKILDFGCGKGDFLRFLLERSIEVDYTGFDISEKLVACADEKFPDARFRVFDIDRDVFDEEFDYIFLCGVFNLEVTGLDAVIRKTMKLLFHHCRIGLAFSALSADDPLKDFQLHYVNHEEIYRFAAMELSSHLRLICNRTFHEFTLFVYRDTKYSVR